jgi:hypothetical protein
LSEPFISREDNPAAHRVMSAPSLTVTNVSILNGQIAELRLSSIRRISPTLPGATSPIHLR